MANSPNTYSFSSVQATINGPGGNAITIGYSAGPTDEGISVERSAGLGALEAVTYVATALSVTHLA